VGAFCRLFKADIASRLGRTCKSGDGIFGGGKIGEQIEAFVSAPSMARERRCGTQHHCFVKRSAARRENVRKHVAFGEDSRPRVDPDTATIVLPRLATGPFRHVHDRHVAALRGEQRGAGQTADSGTNNNDTRLTQVRRLPLAAREYVYHTGHMQPSNIKQKWVGWRNTMLASARFRSWAASFLLTRPIARRRAKAMFDVNAGFIYSQIALAMVETGLIVRLADGPLAIDEAARIAELPAEAADRLLKAAASIELAERLRDGRYMLGALGAALHGNRGIAEMIDHHRHLYADLADPVGLLRRGGGGGALARYWSYARADDPAASADGSVAAYSELMAASQAMVAEQVLAAYDFGRHRRLLDVGGGQGVFARSVKAALPGIEVALFDLPAVAARACGMETHGGNFFEDDLPSGFDLVSLVRILHDHDDAPALKLLRNIARSLPKGGQLMIAEPMAHTAGAESMGDGYFGFYLWAMGSGRPRTKAEIGAMLGEAGFVKMREYPTNLPLIARVITAIRI
jgi:demethylspheroidene O-methyltransferase